MGYSWTPPQWMQNTNPTSPDAQAQIDAYNKVIAHLSGQGDPAGINRQYIDRATQARNALMGGQNALGQFGLNARVAELRGLAGKMADPTLLNQYFDRAAGSLSQRQAQSAGQARSAAAAMAASRGMLNPSGFTQGAASQATQPYAEAFGNLEGQRTQGLINQQKQYYDILAALNAMLTGQGNTERELAIRQQMADLQANNQYYQMNKDNPTDAEVASKAALALAQLFLMPGGGTSGGGTDWMSRQAFGLSPTGYQSPY